MTDSPAFLWAYAVKQDGSARMLKKSQLQQPVQSEEYLWVHMQSDAHDAQEVIAELNIADTVADSLMALETRPRAMAISEGVLIYLRGINKNPDADPEDMVSLRIWIEGNVIVTARRKNRKLLSVQDLRKMLEENNAPESPIEMLLLLVTKLADRIHDTVDEMDDSLVAFETSESLSKSDRQMLANLRRQAASIRRFLAPQRDALDSLLRMTKWLNQDQAMDLREQTDRITRYVEDLDLVRERAVVLQDEVRNRIGEQQGVRMYFLAMVTAVFLPLSFLTGVFGMNVAGLPGTESPEAFDVLMTAMGGLAVFMIVAMVWKRWL
ncbi:zinc transporter ZntB [Alteromonas pelagimontana]|uniref:Zinc transporter ZntB n=1 Tax=Alteromonas pelagimontana TaxID=1858656 RepID=A0A6M4MEW5_9ALTE|nr:zinc transporter ZntB [Alteromonas pelagimontana]QJR81180.1 zinc transporter ZntB [Alteromonas pelagimontana]